MYPQTARNLCLRAAEWAEDHQHDERARAFWRAASRFRPEAPDWRGVIAASRRLLGAAMARPGDGAVGEAGGTAAERPDGAGGDDGGAP